MLATDKTGDIKKFRFWVSCYSFSNVRNHFLSVQPKYNRDIIQGQSPWRLVSDLQQCNISVILTQQGNKCRIIKKGILTFQAAKGSLKKKIKLLLNTDWEFWKLFLDSQSEHI